MVAEAPVGTAGPDRQLWSASWPVYFDIVDSLFAWFVILTPIPLVLMMRTVRLDCGNKDYSTGL
jgi:hypothetical protein